MSSGGCLRSARERFAIATASRITVNVLRPRKSIFSSPSSSIVVIVNWVVTEPSCARASGTNSSIGFGPITTPAAWTELFRGSPSSRSARSIRCCACSLSSYRLFSSGFISSAFEIVMPSSFGIDFATMSQKL